MSRRHFWGGALWTVGGYAAVQAMRLGFNLALTRMVAPKAFGVMALVNLVVLGLQMLSDLGVRQCVVRHARGGEPDFLNTAWTVQVARGAILWAVAALLAWPIAVVYGEPALLWLVPLAGSAAFIGGFTSTSVLTLSREANRGPIVRREVGVFAVTIALVLTALPTLPRWVPAEYHVAAQLAVIAGGAVFSAVGEVMLSYTLPTVSRPRFAWESEAGRHLVGFGGWVLVSTACTFAAAQADRLVIGVLSLETLGVYHIAWVLAMLPPLLASALGYHLLFPRLAAAIRDGEPFASAFGRAHQVLTLFAGWMVTGAVCVGPAFIGLVYDDRYRDAAGYIQLLSVTAWVTAFLLPGEFALLALDRPRSLAVGQGVRLAFLPAFLWVGYSLAGIDGLILGTAAGELVRYLVLARFLAGAGVNVTRIDLAGTVAAAGIVLGYRVVQPVLFAGFGPLLQFLVGGFALTAVWAGLAVAVSGECGAATLRRVVNRGRAQGVAR